MVESCDAARCMSVAPRVVFCAAIATPPIFLVDFSGAAGRFAHVPGHLVGGDGLLFYGRRRCAGNVVDLVDDCADLADGLNRAPGVCLDRLNFSADLFGGFGGFFGEFLDFVGYHRKTFAGFSGTGRFDCGV